MSQYAQLITQTVSFIRAAIFNPQNGRVFFETLSFFKSEICNLKDQWISSDSYISFTKSNYHYYGGPLAVVTGIIIVSAPIWNKAIDRKLSGNDLKQAFVEAGFNLLTAIGVGILASLIAGPQMFPYGFLLGAAISEKFGFGKKMKHRIKQQYNQV